MKTFSWILFTIIFFSNVLMVWNLSSYLNYALTRPYPIHHYPVEEYKKGKASWYDYTLPSGWSSVGHRVCAVRDWPRGTMLKVTYKDKTTTCKVTDHGPNITIHPDRIIDLSSFSFKDLAPLSRGVIEVRVEEVR